MKQLPVFFATVCILFFVSISFISNAQTISDTELKKNISTISNPLQKITSLEPKIFEYNIAEYNYLKLPAGTHYGFINEDVKQLFPALVTRRHHNYMHGKNLFKKATTNMINVEGLVPVLVAAIKEQQIQIDQLRAEIEELKTKLKQ